MSWLGKFGTVSNPCRKKIMFMEMPLMAQPDQSLRDRSGKCLGEDGNHGSTEQPNALKINNRANKVYGCMHNYGFP